MLRHIIWRGSRPEAPALATRWPTAGRPLADRSQGSSCRGHRSNFFFGGFFHLQAEARKQLKDSEAIKQGVEDVKYQHDTE